MQVALHRKDKERSAVYPLYEELRPLLVSNVCQH